MADELRLWFWMIPSETRPGKMYRSRWRMTEADAAAYPGAVKIEGTLEVRPGVAPPAHSAPPRGPDPSSG